MKKETFILAGDVGGTKSLLALYKLEAGQTKPFAEREYASKQFDDFSKIVRHFLQENQMKPEIAVFGIPGPVSRGEVKSTNLPWLIRENDLIRETGIPKVKLINDLAAAAYALPSLLVNETQMLIEGVHVENPQRYVVIAPGTGLGQAFLVCSEGRKIVIPSEGGHAGFAPSNLLENKLFKFLHSRFGRVSLERIISGSGLPNVFDFLVEDQKQQPEKETLEQMKTRDRAIVISEMSLGNKDQVCVQALDIFASVLGRHAGNMSLTFLPDGGVFLAGGIPHKIFPKLSDGSFKKAFLNTGRMETVVSSIPVHVITNNRTVLHGAAQLAFEQLKTQ